MNVFEPNDPLLKKYIDNIYIFEKGQEPVQYTSYPSANTAVGLFRNATVDITDDPVIVQASADTKPFGIAFNRLLRRVNLHYMQMVDEIAINFKPAGFSAFTGWQYTGNSSDCFVFTEWDGDLERLLTHIFRAQEQHERAALLEAFLLSRYTPIDDEDILTRACALLADPNNEDKIQEIAKQVGVHQKYLYRHFMQYIGCSPAHYRKVVKFRNAVYAKLDKGDAMKLIELCYNSNYTDQAYFTKQFHKLTGENPKQFFKDVSAFGKNKVVFRFF
ncbi:MAG: AraC family transcriptional regulator [Flavipsychrobacter sp.]|nr:AraC family transcriptional regulator [Flavipsychrobacter sp.]